MTTSKIADIATGLDIFARAQLWEAMAGHRPFQKIKGVRTPSTLLGIIKSMVGEVDRGLLENPEMEIWWSPLNTRLYGKTLDVASAIVSKFGLEAEDVLAEDMSRDDPKGSVFFSVGRMTLTNPRMMEKLSVGDYLPSTAVTAAKMFIRRHALEAAKQVINRQKLEKGNSDLIVDNTMSGSDTNLTGDEWRMAIDTILGDPTNPLAKEFIQFLMDSSKQMKTYLVSSYLSRVFTLGSANVAEVAEDFNVSPQAVRAQLDKFKGGVANLLANNPNRGGAAVINMLSDAEFLSHLLTGRVRGDKVGKIVKATKADPEKALRSATIKLAHSNPALRQLLLPILSAK